MQSIAPNTGFAWDWPIWQSGIAMGTTPLRSYDYEVYPTFFRIVNIKYAPA
jgi:hypothetical protein